MSVEPREKLPDTIRATLNTTPGAQRWSHDELNALVARLVEAVSVVFSRAGSDPDPEAREKIARALHEARASKYESYDAELRAEVEAVLSVVGGVVAGNPEEVLVRLTLAERDILREAVGVLIGEYGTMSSGVDMSADAKLAAAEPGVSGSAGPEYPRMDGDFTVIGPECFADAEATVVCWRGENYYRGSAGRHEAALRKALDWLEVCAQSHEDNGNPVVAAYFRAARAHIKREFSPPHDDAPEEKP